MHKYLKGRCKEEGARLFSVLPSDKQWAQTEMQEAPSERRKCFFTPRAGKLEAIVLEKNLKEQVKHQIVAGRGWTSSWVLNKSNKHIG